MNIKFVAHGAGLNKISNFSYNLNLYKDTLKLYVFSG